VFHRYSIIFAFVCSVLVLGPLLLPGYVFLLDWIAGPEPHLTYQSLAAMMNVPVDAVRYALVSIVPGWLVQKMILCALIFGLFSIPLRFPVPGVDRLTTFAGSVLFAVNPFVYERLLAGHWRVLAGYICLWIVLHFMVRLLDAQDFHKRDVYRLFLVLFVTGVFSVHSLVMAFILCVLFGLFFLIKMLCAARTGSMRQIVSIGRVFLVSGFFFVLASCYWLVPYFVQGDAYLAGFDGDHAQAFVTAGGERVGPLLNVLIMHGFWGEARPWGEQFIIPRTQMFFAGGFLIMLGAVMTGVWYSMMRVRHLRFGSWFMLVCGLCGLIFSVGVSPTLFQGLNWWLFDTVPLWDGFRDSQKWSGVLIMMYVFFVQRGITGLPFLALRRTAVVVIMIAVFVMTPQMLWGLGGQVQVSDYPDGFYGARAYLAQQEACVAVFLPWHQYYPQSYAGGLLTVNPASRFFPCEIYAGANTDLADIGASQQDADYTAREAFITSNQPSLESASLPEGVALLRSQGVTHVIFSTDYADRDVYQYPFLAHPDFTEVYTDNDVKVYQLTSRSEQENIQEQASRDRDLDPALGAIDTDGDGIWDDMESSIEEAVSVANGSEAVRVSSIQLVRAMQDVVRNLDAEPKVFAEFYDEELQAHECFLYLSDVTDFEVIEVIEILDIINIDFYSYSNERTKGIHKAIADLETSMPYRDRVRAKTDRQRRVVCQTRFNLL